MITWCTFTVGCISSLIDIEQQLGQRVRGAAQKFKAAAGACTQSAAKTLGVACFLLIFIFRLRSSVIRLSRNQAAADTARSLAIRLAETTPVSVS